MIIKKLSNLLLVFIFAFIFVSFDSVAAEPSYSNNYTWNFSASLSNFDSTSGNTSVSSFQETIPYYDWGNFDQSATNTKTYFYRFFGTTGLFTTSSDVYAYKIVMNSPSSFNFSRTNNKFTRVYLGTFNDFFRNTGTFGSNVSSSFSGGNFWFVNDYSEQTVQVGFMGLFYQEDITIPSSTVDEEDHIRRSRPSYSISGSTSFTVYAYSYDDYQLAVILNLGDLAYLQEESNILLDGILTTLQGESIDTPSYNDTAINETTDAEKELIDKDTSSEQESINVTINDNSNNFIWGIVDSFVTVNPKVFTLLISILSLGIISLILNR